MNKKILLNPGPASTSKTVKLSMIKPDICPRVNEFGLEIKNVREELTNLFANKLYTTTLISGSGTASIEAVISSVVSDNKKILIKCEILPIYYIQLIIIRISFTSNLLYLSVFIELIYF